VDRVDRRTLYFTFDGPDSENVTQLEGISGPGDSGGGALIERDGRVYIAGVSCCQDHDGTEGLYGVTEIYPRVSFYAAWIVGVIRPPSTSSSPGDRHSTARRDPWTRDESNRGRHEQGTLVEFAERTVAAGHSEGAALVAIGLLIGLPGVYLAGRLLQGMLFGVSPWDPATLVAVALGLAAVAMAATYIPARRVLGIEPAGVLRQD
jgi:hypothetical protein